MSEPNVRIVMTEHGRGQVFVDGVEIQGVATVGFWAGVSDTNSVTLQLSPRRVVIEAPASVRIDGLELEGKDAAPSAT